MRRWWGWLLQPACNAVLRDVDMAVPCGSGVLEVTAMS